jgi:hypothetical protein
LSHLQQKLRKASELIMLCPFTSAVYLSELIIVYFLLSMTATVPPARPASSAARVPAGLPGPHWWLPKCQALSHETHLGSQSLVSRQVATILFLHVLNLYLISIHCHLWTIEHFFISFCVPRIEDLEPCNFLSVHSPVSKTLILLWMFSTP